ncbi:MAG: 30S ribosomal protein S12 methylthiotransferase RimO [Peptococcaceae bacterium]|nr:30S ribosomal protein S12 methylthiotransferase RimO [Peptococcaceae bacterium]
MNRKIGVISLGCSKNLVDTEIMLGLLTDAGFTITFQINDAKIILINTCGFIKEAKEEAIKTILETAGLKKHGNLETLLVAGCLVQRYRKELMADIPEIDGFIAPGDIGRIVAIAEGAINRDSKYCSEGSDFDYALEIPRLITTPSHWAYVKIAEGCSNRCAYCAIPGIRGRYRSRPIQAIENEVKLLIKKGVQEIILVAQDTTVYGIDIYSRPMISELLKRLASLGPCWIRLMYCYPSQFNKELIEVIAKEDNICKYIDLPLQHISDSVLIRMNRLGSSEEIRRLVYNLRESIADLTLRTTFMVGFPGENDKDYQELYSFIKETRFDRLGAFKFSSEEGTAADKMIDSVPQEVKDFRYNEIMLLQRKISRDINNQRIGEIIKVLVDGKKKGPGNLYIGRSQGDAPEIDGNILFSSGFKVLRPGQFILIKVTGAFDYSLRGVMINESS